MSRFLIALAAIALVSCGVQKNSVTKRTLSTSDIMGGTDVAEGAQIAQSIVAIWDREEKAICTGTIIAPNFVITAAHCVGNARNMKVVFGNDMDLYLNAHEQDVLEERVHQVTDAVIHPDYNDEENEKKNTDWNDIAVLRFTGDLPAGFVPATFLPSSDVLQRGVRVYLAGYGVNYLHAEPINPKKVKNLKQKIETGEVQCEDDMSQCWEVDATGDGLLRETSALISVIGISEVVLDESKGHGTCMGDSGGPAFVKWEDKYYYFGVTSRGSPFCDKKGIYTDATYHRPWIEQTMAKLRR